MPWTAEIQAGAEEHGLEAETRKTRRTSARYADPDEDDEDDDVKAVLPVRGATELPSINVQS